MGRYHGGDAGITNQDLARLLDPQWWRWVLLRRHDPRERNADTVGEAERGVPALAAGFDVVLNPWVKAVADLDYEVLQSLLSIAEAKERQALGLDQPN